MANDREIQKIMRDRERGNEKEMQTISDLAKEKKVLVKTLPPQKLSERGVPQGRKAYRIFDHEGDCHKPGDPPFKLPVSVAQTLLEQGKILRADPIPEIE